MSASYPQFSLALCSLASSLIGDSEPPSILSASFCLSNNGLYELSRSNFDRMSTGWLANGIVDVGGGLDGVDEVVCPFKAAKFNGCPSMAAIEVAVDADGHWNDEELACERCWAMELSELIPESRALARWLENQLHSCW